MSLSSADKRRWYNDPNVPAWKKAAAQYRRRRRQELAEESRGYYSVHHRGQKAPGPLVNKTPPEIAAFFAKLQDAICPPVGRPNKKEALK